jgi:hypothetical protein
MPRRPLQFNIVFGTSLLLLAAMVPYMMIAVFWIERYSVREAMEKKLHETHLVQLQLATGSYTWAKPGKEIRFNNRLFDVKSFTQQKDSIICWGLFDEDEKMLLHAFENFQRKTGKQSTGKLAVSLFLYMGVAQPSPPPFEYVFGIHRVKQHWLLPPNASLALGHALLPEQPPCIG